VRLLDVRLPDVFLETLQGPRFGVEGLRKMLGVHGPPLLATALKPRGTGLLTMGSQRIVLEPMDVVYLQPLEVHQLHNETKAPFGFLCIVDRERDRPMKP